MPGSSAGRDAVVGVDLGTQSTKAALVALDGEPLAAAAVEVEVEHPRPGWAQQDASVLESSSLTAISMALARAPVAVTVRALAVAGQMGGAIGIDERHAPVTPHESWLDTRADADRAEVIAAAGEEIRAANGVLPFVGPRARRWLRLDPGLGDRLARVVAPAGYVVGRLTGAGAADATCDRTQANLFGCFDCRAGRWDIALAEAAGIPPRMLPRVVEPVEIVGRLTADAAERTGLPAGLPVAGGTGDGTAGWLAAGAYEPGICVDTGGTSDHFAVAVDRFTPDPLHVMTCMPSALPDLFHVMGFTTGTGLAKGWLARLVADGDYDRLEAEAASVPAGAGGILCVPHLHGRVTPFEPDVHGAFVGFDEATGGVHLYCAILEGVAFEFAEWVEHTRRLAPEVEIRRAIAIGGSASSRVAVQAKASVLGLSYTLAREHVNAARGAALVAAASIGAVGLDDRGWCGPGRIAAATVEPDPAATGTYARLAPAYRALHGALAPVYTLLAEAKA